MTIQIQCQNCFHWVTENFLLAKLVSLFGVEFVRKCGVCGRAIKFTLMK